MRKDWCASVGGRRGSGKRSQGWRVGNWVSRGEWGVELLGKECKEVCWLVCSWKRIYMNIHVYKNHKFIIEETVKFMES